jgi:hypothetical protein
MNERALKAQLAAAKKKIAQLERELAEEIRKNKPKSPEPLAPSYTGTPTEPKKAYDPQNPIKPGADPVWDAFQASKKRRSRLNE